MKREWTDLDFADWTLLPSEAALLANKTGPSCVDPPHRLATNPAAIRSDEQACHRLTLGHSGDGGDFETLHPQQAQTSHLPSFCRVGKAIKTIFLCRYLHSEALRREIQEGLNVIETRNGANSFILYGKGGEIR